MSELKPCPFCGGEAIVIKTDLGDGCAEFYHAVCLDCSVEMKQYECMTRKEAIEAWNRRASE